MHIDTTGWGWQQWYFVGMWTLTMVLLPIVHGEPKKGKYNAFSMMINIALMAAILINGGFFNRG